MGRSEDMISPKSEKASPKTDKVSPSKQEHTNIHLYPDWATIQAYYGHGVPIPPSYLNPAVMAGHVPHPHVWAPPQSVMPPYGMPYPAIYAPGVVYAHPAVPLAATPVSAQLLSNSSDNMDQGLTKKLKRMDGVAMQVVSNNADVDGEGSAHGASQRVERGIDASSNAQRRLRKSDSLGKLSTDNDVKKVHKQARPIPEEDAIVTSSRVSGIIVAPENVAGKPVDSLNGIAETSATCSASSAGAELPCEGCWIQDERQLKREKRKHANRESARRSRIRKQAETEELLKRYETVKVENITLQSEMNQLMEESEKLRVENAALMEKLNGAEFARPGEMVLDKIGPDLAQPNRSGDGVLLNNSGPVKKNKGRKCETFENSVLR